MKKLVLLLCIFMLPQESPVQLNICLGIPNALHPIGSCAGMVSLGASLIGRLKLDEEMSVDIRTGEGFPLYFETTKDILRDTRFPFGLWPDIVATVSLKI